MDVFTDGSCVNNGKSNARAGCGIVWPNNEFEPLSFKIPKEESQTNNRAEFIASIIAMEQMMTIDPSGEKVLNIFTDSKLLINTATKWINGWKNNNWTKKSKGDIANIDLVKRIDELINKRVVKWTYVKAHTSGTDYNSQWNSVADKLARDSADL